MTDNDNTHNRTRPYQRQQPEVPEVDIEFARFIFQWAKHYFWRSMDARTQEQALQDAIADWKAQQAEKE